MVWARSDALLEPLPSFRDVLIIVLLETRDSCTEGIGFADGKELGKKCVGALLPCVDDASFRTEPLLRLPEQ